MVQLIVADNDAGLANRIKNIVSCFRCEDELHQKIWINWILITEESGKNHLFNCKFKYLFKNKEDRKNTFLYNNKLSQGKVVTNNSHQLIIFDKDEIPKYFDKYNPRMAKYNRTRKDGKYIDFNYNRIPKVCKDNYIPYFKKLLVIDELQKKINNFSNDNFNEFTVSVHIRSWGQRNEHLRNRVLFQKKGLQLFENAMLKKLEENKKTNFFLSTDCSAIKKYFLDHNKLKNYIKYYPRSSSHGNSRSNKEGIQEDLIDLYLLSKNKSIIGSHNSTFTEVAWWLAECPEDITIIYAGK